ncbi:MAG TPA: hypothetical protein VK255_01805, partial [Patescibacteria group bacterium]|nr:hypothetical protein [Patescibacteria group bacterium]
MMKNSRKNSFTVKKNRKLQSIDIPSSSPRISILAFFIFAIASVIIIRIYFLQVVSYASYRALADEQHSIFKKLIPKRGEMYLKDKNGLYPVALNRDIKMAYAVPKEIKNADEAARLISPILGIDQGELYQKFNQPEDMYEVLKHKLSDDEIQKINESKLDGIHLSDETFRYYPAGELASHVLGFVGWRENEFGGQYGLEKYLDTKLRGKEGNIFTQKDNAGRHIA